ncbi:MAG TPA: vanadium-dependent haloperoxidase [Terriglobales bacterium]|nr:vanadium-dependent haloperoxidase [Terriglobales bacterium]
MQLAGFARALLVIGLTGALESSAAAQNPVVDWDAIAATTIITNGATASNITKTAPGAITQGGSSFYLAFVHLAIYNAVNAISPHYQPYVYSLKAPHHASREAAVVAAAHRILVHYFPDQQAALDAQYAESLAAIPDGESKADGIRIGEVSALTLIALRANDGRGANVPYAYPSVPTPGVWIPTPPAFLAPLTPWVGQMRPFTMTSPAQFLPKSGPPDLGSERWARNFNETKTLGAVNSPVRTPQQTEIGLFWTDHAGQQYARAFRGLAIEQKLDISESARLFAMLFTAYADSFIGCMNAKYTFSFWRPVTAVQNADLDGNPDTIQDPSWLPLGVTPNHPEFPANHGCVSGAIAATLQDFFEDRKFSFTVSSAVTNTTHHFQSARELEKEVFGARIYAGFHYRHSLEQGFLLGHRVVRQMLRQQFRPLKE